MEDFNIHYQNYDIAFKVSFEKDKEDIIEFLKLDIQVFKDMLKQSS